jgi:hypothetical protein
MCVCRNAATSDFRPDVGGVDIQINIACPSNMIMVALGGKFWSTTILGIRMEWEIMKPDCWRQGCGDRKIYSGWRCHSDMGRATLKKAESKQTK